MENETKTDITDGQVQPLEEETTQTYKPQWRPQDADREYIKITTRKRIRETVAHPNAIFKPAKPAPNINDTGHKRVAVYARVSTKSTEQVSSIENQTKYYTEKTKKYYALSMVRPSKSNGLPTDKEERAKALEGQYLFSRALEPDEAYLDEENSVLTIFEKKFQATAGSADEKLQTCGFKLQQYQKLAKELGIDQVYYIYILSDYFNSSYYKDVLAYIKSIPNCDYFFASEE